jgi:hypothetical protein
MRQLFPYIGGKYTVASEINRRFGAIDTRIDAFTGSSSWILASEPVRYEIVNDLDGYVVNYLRAIKYAPEEVARHLDFPRAELELIAYHHYTRDKLPELVARLGGDPDYYDPVIAARWAYVMAYKLDPSLLKPGGWLTRDGRLVYERGVGRKRGSMTSNASSYSLVSSENAGFRNTSLRSLNDCAAFKYSGTILRLSPRNQKHSHIRRCRHSVSTRPTRATCGISTTTPTAQMSGIAPRAGRSLNGDNPKLRIAVCGYSDEESDALFPPDWARFIWRRIGIGQNKDMECIWFSPHCGGRQ